MRLMTLFLFLLVLGCSVKKNDLSNQTSQGHQQLYSEPEAPEKAEEQFKRIIIASTNDIEGHYGPVNVSFEDTHHKGNQQIEVGGADYISAYFKVLRDVYRHVLLVDAGDLLPTDTKNLKDSSHFYSSLNYDALTIGLSDFNRQLPKESKSSNNLIRDFAKISPTPVLLGNLYELKTARGVEWTGTKPYVIKEINGIKVGIIGIVPNDIVSLTPVDNRIGLYVESMVQNTLLHARLVRSLGAQLVVVLTHQGVDCASQMAKSIKLPVSKVNFEPQKENVCEMIGPMGDYLNRLPPHLVDVVIGGRHHQKMANIHNGMVLLSGFENGKSFNFAEFNFEAKSGKLVKDKTVIHQPVMFCHQFFKETDDCFTEDSSVDHQARTPAVFLGTTIVPDQSMKKKFSKYFVPRAASHSWNFPITETLTRFEVDLVYRPSTPGDSQLMIIEIAGRDLSRMLEARFNNSQIDEWLPSPFRKNGSSLYLQVNEKNLLPLKRYRVLADIESLQNDHQLRKFINVDRTLSLQTHSWKSLQLESDEVSLQMAASQRQ